MVDQVSTFVGWFLIGGAFMLCACTTYLAGFCEPDDGDDECPK